MKTNKVREARARQMQGEFIYFSAGIFRNF